MIPFRKEGVRDHIVDCNDYYSTVVLIMQGEVEQIAVRIIDFRSLYTLEVSGQGKLA
jgi:hypothetical protein